MKCKDYVEVVDASVSQTAASFCVPSLRQWRHERGRFFVLTQRGGKVAYLVVPSRTQTQYAVADSAATVAAQSNAPGPSWGANFAQWFFVGIRKSFGKSIGYSQAPTGRV